MWWRVDFLEAITLVATWPQTLQTRPPPLKRILVDMDLPLPGKHVWKTSRLKELFPCKTSVTGVYTIETTAILGQRISFNGLISYIPTLSRWSLSMRIKTTALSYEAVFPKINKGREWTNDKQSMYKPRHNWAFYVPSWPALQYRGQRCKVNYYNSFFSSSKTFS